jgi:hypothetical protein
MELAGAGSEDQIKTAPNVRSADSDEALQEQVQPAHCLMIAAPALVACVGALACCLLSEKAQHSCWLQLSCRPPRGPLL